ncbi:hypothetical protein [Flavobacterium sp.]|uniref:hypothetical protein n=1 Tax=Flavobacterium sp. TaxID=239 RepID=UPI002FD914C4
MNKIKIYLIRIYRLLLNYEKQEEVIWKDIKKLHADCGWRSGVYENDKYIETVFEISKETPVVFHYIVGKYSFHCSVKILENYPLDLTTDFFILATHFNNVLSDGVVIVNVNNHYIEYHHKVNLLLPLLYRNEIYSQIIRHYDTARDIYEAFQRLINENESPAIIIADILNRNNNQEKKDK